MSPREKHIPDEAQRTSICLIAEDRAAIRWLSEVRRGKKDRRTTINDILVDALWYFLDKTEGKTRDQIRSMLPAVSMDARSAKNKIREMPRPRKR